MCNQSTTGTDSAAVVGRVVPDVPPEHNRDGFRGAEEHLTAEMAWLRARSRRIGAPVAQIDLARGVAQHESVDLASVGPLVHIPRSAGAIQPNTAVQTRRRSCPYPSIRSMTVAIPWPTPMHMAARP
jgi:hypothetical protein